MNNKKSVKNLIIGSVILSIIAAFSVSAFGAKYDPPKSPKIEYFKSDLANVEPGQTAMLSWSVVNASNIEVTGLEKEPEELLPMQGSLEVWPMQTTVYTLTATSANGAIVKSNLTITVGKTQEVKIDFFKVDKTQVKPGDTVVLSWKTVNAKSLDIKGFEKESEEMLPLEGTLEVWPMATTVYVLDAVGTNGKIVSTSLTVTVQGESKLKIVSFTASKAQIKKGERVQLSWSTQNAKKCILKAPGIKDINLDANGTLWVQPKHTTNYKLVAISSEGSRVRQKAMVQVRNGNKVDQIIEQIKNFLPLTRCS